MKKLTAISMHRYRADAKIQRRLGLRVGGTETEFSVSDGETTKTITAWGPTPGARATVAKLAFLERAKPGEMWYGACDSEGRQSAAEIKRDPPGSASQYGLGYMQGQGGL